jgi:hypothetical protein
MQTWRDSLAAANNKRTLERTRTGLNKKTAYILGQGGFKPLDPLTPKCDCSGFVAWAIGIPRELPPGSDHWLQTDTYWAGGADVGSGLFDRVSESEARAGDIYVFPDSGGHQGHMGIITEVSGGRPSKVIHCSSGNFRRTGDAIQETGTSVFATHPRIRIVRVDYEAMRAKLRISPSAEDTTEEALAETDPLPKPQGKLTSPLLSSDATLRGIIVGKAPALKKTGGRMGGAGVLQEALNLIAEKAGITKIDLGEEDRNRGIFGGKTDEAVRAYQHVRKLQVDGEAGPKTLLALDADLQEINADEVVSPQIDRIGNVPSCDAEEFFKIGRTRVFRLRREGEPTAYFYESGMTINADGSPRAYHPGGSPPGLDKLANAGRPGNWWGIATDSGGRPFVQGSNDTAPGYYVSTTALIDPSKPARSPSRYVNSETINFIVNARGMSGGAKLGDFAAVVFRGRVAYGVCADIGPADHLGEGSIALANALGIPSSPRNGGTGHEVAYVVFPGSRAGWPLTQAGIDERAATLFEAWGGLGQVIGCMGT